MIRRRGAAVGSVIDGWRDIGWGRTSEVGASDSHSDSFRVRIRAAVELGQVSVQMEATVMGCVDHGCQSIGLGFERLDLAIDPLTSIDDQDAPLSLVGGRSEAFAIALASRVVLEQLADLGE